MDFEDIGYIHYSSFGNRVSESNLDYALEKFKDYKGIIIDVRSNGGGAMSNAVRISQRFADTRTLALLRQDKTGPGREDFTGKYKVYIEPSGNSVKFTGPVVILSNRLSYSATNYMIGLMRELPNVTVIGDKSGGGGGIPAYTELSNGWVLRVSSTRIFTPAGLNIENGIPADIQVDITAEDDRNDIDTILEYALEFLRN
jgi:C-terminal processing protease CtpA/Prc